MLDEFNTPGEEKEENPADIANQSTAGQVKNLVNALIEQYQTAVCEKTLGGRFAQLHTHALAGHDLDLYKVWLAEAHSYFRADASNDVTITFTSEWILDNYYIISQALLQIKEDLPRKYQAQLPKLTGGPLKGLPRIYAIARGVLSYQRHLLNLIDLETILIQFQERVPLTMGELWALPIFLRYVCIETLAHELAVVIHPRSAPHLPINLPQFFANGEQKNPIQPVTENRGVADVILSLRSISEQNWNDFFESVSCLQKILAQDPAGIYLQMDFKTRDLYRKELEMLSFATGFAENELAEITLDLARQGALEEANIPGYPPQSPSGLRSHVGEYLLGNSRADLEKQIDYHPNLKIVINRWSRRHATSLYLGSIFGMTIVVLGLLAMLVNLPALFANASLIQQILIWLIGLTLIIPVVTGVTNLANWLVTMWFPPCILPKIHFKEEIPAAYKTLVVIPALINGRDEIDSLTGQIELQYLRNPEPGLLFALLTDFRDADSETLPEDDALLNYATNAMDELNAKYQRSAADQTVQETSPLFYLLHRKRLWNPSEGKWMGWERKRGKLHEMNLLLRGAQPNNARLSFLNINGCLDGHGALQAVHFVITLDADTILPRGAARRLAGTLAHPLNRAKFDDRTGQVVSGYTVLQPRMEIHPRSTNYSWFTRIFAGDTGLDLYTRAVSDAYQDLFGEGSFVGKGIYDVDSFERSVDQRIPENSVLSHDLLEGLMGRAGLVTDITMIEDYPQNYLIQVMRQSRWVRGDWQLLPWLLNQTKSKVPFSVIDRWKITDNLLRFIQIPALIGAFVLGLLFWPQFARGWVAIIQIFLGIPMFTTLMGSVIRLLKGEKLGSAFNNTGANLVRWLLAIIFLPYEAFVNLQAILTTLYRLTISRRNLLQWTTAAQATKLFGQRNNRNAAWQKMGVTALCSLGLGVGIQIIYLFSGNGVAPALIISAPLLILWLLSPAIVDRLNRPIQIKKVELSEEQAVLLRQVIRRTWGFFERFVGPEDHWLPPDHYQEAPVGIVAHHTSPSNMGLLLTSTIAAYDFGYLDHLGLLARLSTNMNTLAQLTRYRGHFLNWYDTLTLQPLRPHYISTVDSGNLAASLIITAQACKTIVNDRVFRWDLWQGYLDTLANLSETLSGMRKVEFDQQVEVINRQIAEMRSQILVVQNKPDAWFALFQVVSGSFWQSLSGTLMKMVEIGRSAFTLEALRKLQEVAAQVERLHLGVQRTLVELVPWIFLLDQPPILFKQVEYGPTFNLLKAELPYNPLLSEITIHASAGLTHSAALRALLMMDRSAALLEATSEFEAGKWLDALEHVLTQAVTNTSAVLADFSQVATIAEQFVYEMDFRFLYHPQRRVFHIGFNLDSGQLDNNYYDLLASEARIASIIAIAKGEVPQSHWLQLGRPLTRVGGLYVLLSWSATMFEYLMPPLFLRSYPGTLLADSTQGAVHHQIAYGKAKRVPWGISESGFRRFDANQNYQYRAFGVPGLGFKRGLADDLVIAPYASLIAISYDPLAVVRNLADLVEHHMIGLYGVYEAIDFTTDRMQLDKSSAVIYEYMAHHQGMIMMAMANFFHHDIMVQRMHCDPRIQSVELLLQEQVSQSVPLQDPYAEDIKSVRRLTVAPIEITPWRVPVHTPIPQVHLLSNGNYNVLVSNMGGGYSSWKDIDLTRWHPDGVLDPWGTWVYIQEAGIDATQADKLWSAGHQPIPGDAAGMQVTYFAHMAVFRRTENEITSTMEVTVAPNDPVEIRRIHLHNDTTRVRSLRLTSYGEVILSAQSADTRHPAFNKLFIESEFVPELDLQIFTRRPRSENEPGIYMGHLLAFKGNQQAAGNEADRNRFIGRSHTMRDPVALTSPQYLGGTDAATLDPIFALGRQIELDALGTADIAFLTFAAESREEILALANRYLAWSLVERSFHQADIAAQTWMGKQEIITSAFKNILQLLSGLIYSYKLVRASTEVISANRLGQPGLWRFGISGDYPILLVELDDAQQVDLVREVILAHRYLRSRRFKLDVVLLNRQQTDYGAELKGLLYRMVSRMNGEEWLNQRGGIYILYTDQMKPDEYTLLKTAARVVVFGENGSLGKQTPGYSIQVHHLPEFSPTRAPEDPMIEPPLGQVKKEDLQFYNGYGGFHADGREYVIDLPANKTTPAPWVNVIGYPRFGFMVSEAGSQCTWALNSGENRLTPWSNDPVCDPTGEALYLRDEETGQVWTPTPLPSGAGQAFRVTHGAGYSTFEHSSHGLRHSLTLFASPEDPVKIIHLKVENMLSHTRRITATQYVEWVLGTTHAANMDYIIPEYDADQECLLATNPYNTEFGSRVAFLIASKPVHGLTADRTEFIGRGGSMVCPAAFQRLGLEARITPGEDPCAALQIHLDLLPGMSEEIYFVLGQGNDREHALGLAKKYHEPANIGAAYERTMIFWDHLLDTVQVQTPDPAANLILNRWMLYQTISCRIWGRTGFYQSSGAFGFRDQLQDVLALLPIAPAVTRSHILNAAKHQFEEGDVMHWWHPPSGRGVRTRISDNLLWLPYVSALYIEATGDTTLLDEKIPFLKSPVLADGESERYGESPQSDQSFTILEHCHRALNKGSTKGSHSLPLIGTGDWNDGLNRIGESGRGESIWLGWFLSDVLKRFAAICEQLGYLDDAQMYRSRAEGYAAAIEECAWDGAWYRRAFDDEGQALGSEENLECQIDSIAQSWAVLSGAGDRLRSREAMQSVLKRLVRPEDQLLLLFEPPFDKDERDPGYIKGYLPGIRENGGQYTHAATWTAWAFAALGEGQQAGELFGLLNPISHSDSLEKASRYRVEPYVICADIYSQAPFIGRGGWTWYTGSAAWMYRLGIEAILGFKKIGDTLHIAPVIPPAWDGFSIRYRYGESVYNIQVNNPNHVASHVLSIQLDGRTMEDLIIPLVDEHLTHQVVVTMGRLDR